MYPFVFVCIVKCLFQWLWIVCAHLLSLRECWDICIFVCLGETPKPRDKVSTKTLPIQPTILFFSIANHYTCLFESTSFNKRYLLLFGVLYPRLCSLCVDYFHCIEFCSVPALHLSLDFCFWTPFGLWENSVALITWDCGTLKAHRQHQQHQFPQYPVWSEDDLVGGKTLYEGRTAERTRVSR